MRRKEREITNKEELEAILKACKICTLAVWEKEGPYIVPLNYGYTYTNDKLTLFFHSAPEGRKVSAMKQHPFVSFNMYCNSELVSGGEVACKYTYKFQSITGEGKVVFIEDPQAKRDGLDILMQHQTNNKKTFTYEDKSLKAITVFKIEVTSFSGKGC